MVQNFHEIAKNHMNVKFHDKNFMIAKFFRDYLCATAPTLTIHVVAPPTILTRDIGACIKCEDERIEITLSRFEF